MKTRFASGLFLALTALMASPVLAQRPREANEGDQAPDFTLQDPKGEKTVKLSDLRGKPVVLLFGSCT